MENNIRILLEKFIRDACTPEERERLFGYLRSADADDELRRLIEEELRRQSGQAAGEAAPGQAGEFAAGSQPEIPQEQSTGPAVEVSAAMKENIFRHIRRAGDTGRAKSPGEAKVRWLSFRRMAAALTGMLVLAAAAYWFLLREDMVTYATGYGETATLWLPDSSKVTLNGNSAIRYAADWDGDRGREVWIGEGEVFFSVTHMPDHRNFTVHTSGNAAVEVLGTEFNVYDREQTTRVVLNSGSIRLNLPGKYAAGPLMMSPGEMVEIREGQGNFRKQKVDTESYTSWKDSRIILDNTPFREIASMLEHTYGLSVSAGDTALYEERFSGTIPSGDAGVLLKALSISFGLEVTRQGDRVVFETVNQ